ncbi:hypothetical protein OQA88_8528 [Cercophora sp. LCS_1]
MTFVLSDHSIDTGDNTTTIANTVENPVAHGHGHNVAVRTRHLILDLLDDTTQFDELVLGALKVIRGFATFLDKSSYGNHCRSDCLDNGQTCSRDAQGIRHLDEDSRHGQEDATTKHQTSGR